MARKGRGRVPLVLLGKERGTTDVVRSSRPADDATAARGGRRHGRDETSARREASDGIWGGLGGEREADDGIWSRIGDEGDRRQDLGRVPLEKLRFG